jgi:hypothetical protein
MKKIYLSFIALILTIVSWGQFVDDFSYTTGTNLTTNGWTQIGAGTTGPLTVNSAGLSYPNSPSSGVGFGVNMAPGQQVVGRGGGILSVSPAVAGATAYMSFLVNLSAAGNTAGVNFAGIMNGTFPTPGVAARAFTRQSGAGFNFGVGKSTLTATYESTVRSLNTTYLVVLKYTVNTGSSTDDIVDMWINPVLGATEPTSTLSMGAGVNDASSALFGPTLNPRAAPAAPTLEIDAVRVGTSWISVTPSNVALSVSTSTLAFGTLPIGSSSPSQTFNLSGTNLTPASGNITVTAPSAVYQVSNDNSTWGSTTTIPYTGSNLSATPVYVRFTPAASGIAPAGNITLSGGSVIVTPTVALTGSGGTPFYSKPTGSLSSLSTWGSVADGSGSAPADFISEYQIFNVVNRVSYTLDADLQILGLGSKLVVGDGTNATKLILPAAFTITSPLDNKVDVTNNATVEIANKIYRNGVSDPTKIPFPYFGTVATNSTVEYSWAGNTTADTVRIAPEIFGNLKLINGLKYFSNTNTAFTFANGNLEIINVEAVGGTGSGSSSVLVRGNVTMSGTSVFDTDITRRVNLNFGGLGTQTVSGGDFYVGQLRTQTVAAAGAFTLDVVLAPGTNIFTGTSTGGGFNFQQPTHSLSLNGNTLTMLNGSSFVSTNQGSINGSSTSNLLINKTEGASNIGTVNFKSGGQLLNNFTYNSAGTGLNNLTLNTPLLVSGTMSLVGGNILLGANTLTSAGTLSGGSSTGYIVTNGIGSFKVTNVIGPIAAIFPVGPSTSLYHPATIINSGTSDNFSVNVVSAAATCVDAAASVTTTWNINEDVVGGSDCTFTFDYTGAAVGGTYSAATAKIAHCGGLSPFYSNGSVLGNIATGSGFTSFSPFAITSNITVLPVTLVRFSGVKQGNNNNLSWVTSSEQNNRGFEVERSIDGQNFAAISFVPSQALNGSVGNITYSYVDVNPVGTVHYYRLRQVDNNNQSKYSVVLKIANSIGKGITLQNVIPNPALNNLTANIATSIKGNAALQIIDFMGRVQIKKQVMLQQGTNIIPVDVSTLKTGLYVLKVVSDDVSESATIKFVKQ